MAAQENIDGILDCLQDIFSTKDGLRRVVETVLGIGMREEVAAHVGAGRHDRSDERRGYRNGTKPRTLATRVGQLDLSVPQVRGCEPYHPSMFARWQRSERALRGVKLVVSDAHSGIRAAIARHFQGISWQRCRVHYKREMGRKVSYKKLKELNRELACVFAGEGKAECLKRGEEMALLWEKSCPAVAAMLRESLEDCLTAESFPERHRKRLRSTNLLENMMKRLKKRTRVVGVFPSRSSCDRLVGSQLLELHEAWQTETKAYFNMESVGA